MRHYFLSTIMLFAFAACQASEPQGPENPVNEAAPAPAAQEQAAPADQAAVTQAKAALSESAAQAARTAAAEKEKLAAAARARMAAAQARSQAASQMASDLAEARAAAQPAASQTTSSQNEQPVSKMDASAKALATAEQAKPAAPSGDVASGKTLARKCAICHNFNAKKKVGPGLKGVFGRKAGSMPGFSYKFTDFIQPGKAWHWDATHLAAWVCNSAEAVRSFTGDAAAKTKMPAQRICDPAKQADIIAYLKTL